MSKDPKLDRLHAAPLFAAADKKELSRLAQAIDMIDVPAGRTLIRQGTRSHEAFVIESGEADVEIDGELIATIPAGEMVGEIGLITQSSATATVTAKTDMSVLVIPYQRFEAVLSDTPGLSWAIAKELARRLQATDARLH